MVTKAVMKPKKTINEDDGKGDWNVVEEKREK